MKQERITYVKRCLNNRCTKKEQCEHGQAQIRFLQYFPNGMKDIPLNMLQMSRAINPVACVCTRWKMSKEQCIEFQNKKQYGL